MKPDQTYGAVTRLALGLAITYAVPARLAAQSSPAVNEEVVQLSPFLVDATEDTGYRATSTISGTRLNTSLNDIASSLTEITAELMEDLGATNAVDVLQYVPNTDTDDGQVFTDINANGALWSTTYKSRGYAVTNLSTDFLPSLIPLDMYNMERLTFARGPNSILFGLGGPGGISNGASKSALFRSLTQVALRFDDEGSKRAAIDINRVLIADRLALRIAAVSDDRNTFTKPSALNKTQRAYLAAKYQITRDASLRFHYERGFYDAHLDRQWIAGDGISSWLAAPEGSKPTVVAGQQGTITNSNIVPGVDNWGGAYRPVMVYAGAGTEVVPMVWRQMGKSQTPNVVDRLDRAYLQDSTLYPWNANLSGAANGFYSRFRNNSAFYEHRFFNAVDLQLTYSKQKSERLIDVTSRTPRYIVYIDVNEVLPNGQPNPNFRSFYTESDAPVVIKNNNEKETLRATLAYELDLQKRVGNGLLGKLLGRHQFALLGERYDNQMASSTHFLSNFAGLETNIPGQRAPNNILTAVNNGNNNLSLRWYLDPAKGVFGPENSPIFDYPLIYSGMIDQTVRENGLALGFRVNASDIVLEELESAMLAMQSRFWNDRVILTLGWRKDSQTVYRPILPAGPDALRVNPIGLDAKALVLDPLKSEGDTTTRGVVFHATSNISLFYNQSSSFLPPPANANDVFSRPFGNITGQGDDYGIRLRLFDNRLFLSATAFKTNQINDVQGSIINGTGIAFPGPINAIWDRLADFTGDNTWLNPPYKPVAGNWQGTQDFEADGYEFEITANPTSQWRFTFNAAHQNNVVSNFGEEFHEYIAANLPIWRSFPGLGDIQIDNATYPTVNAAIDLILEGQARLLALNSQTDGRQPQWSANMITNYRFAENSRLKGFSIGASARWREARIIGYVKNQVTQGFITDQPFYGKDTKTFNGTIAYRGRIGDIGYRVQLNINNLFNDRGIDPLLAEDDGTGNPVIVGAKYPQGRSFALSTTFDF